MGYQGLGDDNITGDPTPIASPPEIQPPPQLMNAHGSPCTDPIWALTRDEMVRLCRVYEEEMGIMYPVTNIEKVIIHGKNCKDHCSFSLGFALISALYHDSYLIWNRLSIVSPDIQCSV
jgi:hypothetical protein